MKNIFKFFIAGLILCSIAISIPQNNLIPSSVLSRRTKVIPEFIEEWQDPDISKSTILELNTIFNNNVSSADSPYQKSATEFKMLGAVLSDFLAGNISSDQIVQGLKKLSEEDKADRSFKVNQSLREFLAFLINSPPKRYGLTKLFNSINENRNSLEAQEEDMRQAQNGSFNEYVDAVSARAARLAAGRSLNGDVTATGENMESIRDIDSVRFFNNYISELGIRAKAISNENVLYTVAQNDLKAAVIPLKALNYARGGNGEFEWCFDHVTMRQYIAFHLGRSNIYGLSMTEAENKPNSVQGAHSHGNFEEETIFLSDGVEISSANSQIYDFGDMSFAPVVDGRGISHQLNNPNSYPTIDFTLKGPLGQLIKATGGEVGDLGIESSGVRTEAWGRVYSQVYRKNEGVLYAAARTEGGELIFRGGNIVEELAMSVRADVSVVNSGKTTDQIPFLPLDGNTQVIRIFPWPANIPEGTTQWLSEENIAKIKAGVTVVDSEGNEATVVVGGGDVVVLNQSGSKLSGFEGVLNGDIVGYKIENQSEDNLELMFLTQTDANLPNAMSE